MDSNQHTLNRAVRFAGVGLHSGDPVSLTIKPAEINSGIRFVRTDQAQKIPTPAFMDRVIDTRLAMTIMTEDEAVIGTTEHVLAALLGLGVDNAIIELDGSEVPVMDGSAGPFVQVLRKIGRKRQKACKWMLKITKEIAFNNGDCAVKVVPYDGFKVSCEIDFKHPMIRKQAYSLDVTPRAFAYEIASARTFGFLAQVEKLRESGFALGGSLQNSIVVDENGIINKEGLRFADEFVRHKVLDLIGDMALLGFPMLGHVIASKSGHDVHFSLMKEIAANPDSWKLIACKGEGNKRVLERVAHTTKAAGEMIMPFLLPPSIALAGVHCTA